MASVPNIPPLTAIKDPAVKLVLQAIIDQLRVRNGEVGDGSNKFVTPTDVQKAIAASK